MLEREGLFGYPSGGELGSDPALETDLEIVENGGGRVSSREGSLEVDVDITDCSAMRLRL